MFFKGGCETKRPELKECTLPCLIVEDIILQKSIFYTKCRLLWPPPPILRFLSKIVHFVHFPIQISYKTTILHFIMTPHFKEISGNL